MRCRPVQASKMINSMIKYTTRVEADDSKLKKAYLWDFVLRTHDNIWRSVHSYVSSDQAKPTPNIGLEASDRLRQWRIKLSSVIPRQHKPSQEWITLLKTMLAKRNWTHVMAPGMPNRMEPLLWQYLSYWRDEANLPSVWQTLFASDIQQANAAKNSAIKCAI